MSEPDLSSLRLIPSVDELLSRPRAAALRDSYAPAYLTAAARRLVEGWRQGVKEGRLDAAALNALAVRADEELEELTRNELEPLPRRVINATGVVIHTNLGRAPWAPEVARRALEAATRYSTLELEIETGQRGKREAQLAKGRLLFAEAEEVLAVNNCAAAVLLALNTLAEGMEVIVSRGELVEIGGSFRIPDVLAKSGAVLREVGTTNRTRLADYESAINQNTAVLLKVHPSNYRIVGFTESVTAAALAPLAERHGLVVLEDLGSGLVSDLEAYVPGEPTLAQTLSSGVDVVTVSGDKLFGGPQAGLILGRADLVEAMRRNPLYRALRPDKVTLAALDACFEIYLTRDPLRELPALSRIAVPPEVLGGRCEALAARLGSIEGLEVEIIRSAGAVGGGAAPVVELPAPVVALRMARPAAALMTALRRVRPPVIARVEDERVIIDLRCVADDEEGLVVDAIARIARAG